MAGSGSIPSPEKDRLSVSQSLSEETLSSRRHQVLIVEDNQSDVYLIRRAIEGTKLPVDFHVTRDGELAIRFFDRADADPAQPCPDLVILDINLPKRQGGDVLRHMRSRSRSAKANVIVVSTSKSDRDREAMKELGADAYFKKPSEFDEFMKLGDIVKRVLTRNVN